MQTLPCFKNMDSCPNSSSPERYSPNLFKISMSIAFNTLSARNSNTRSARNSFTSRAPRRLRRRTLCNLQIRAKIHPHFPGTLPTGGNV
jgi:hypothetical protein